MRTIQTPVVLEVHQPEKFRAQRLVQSISNVYKDDIPVIEVFRTLEGEGSHVGIPRVLARVSGCAVGCAWCDSKHTWKVRDGKMMPVEEFANRIIEEANGYTNEVSITGGEPMHYPAQMIALTRLLHAQGFRVSIETSGTIISHEVFKHFDLVSLDVKTPSSRVEYEPRLLQELLTVVMYHPGAQLKAVVSNEEDLAWIEQNLMELLKPKRPDLKPLILTPCADNTQGDVPLSELTRVIDMVIAWNKSYNIRVLAQQHKMIFRDPDLTENMKKIGGK